MEKDGAFVNSSRWAQWKNIALDPPGQAKRDQEIIARLFLKIRQSSADTNSSSKHVDSVMALRPQALGGQT